MSDHLEANRELITAWMEKKRSEVPIPFYGSVDVRDAGWKIAVVDANHFPAGFNNIADQDLPSISQLMGTHIKRNYGECSWIHLYPEAHTRNKGCTWYMWAMASVWPGPDLGGPAPYV